MTGPKGLISILMALQPLENNAYIGNQGPTLTLGVFMINRLPNIHQMTFHDIIKVGQPYRFFQDFSYSNIQIVIEILNFQIPGG